MCEVSDVRRDRQTDRKARLSLSLVTIVIPFQCTRHLPYIYCLGPFWVLSRCVLKNPQLEKGGMLILTFSLDRTSGDSISRRQNFAILPPCLPALEPAASSPSVEFFQGIGAHELKDYVVEAASAYLPVGTVGIVDMLDTGTRRRPLAWLCQSQGIELSPRGLESVPSAKQRQIGHPGRLEAPARTHLSEHRPDLTFSKTPGISTFLAVRQFPSFHYDGENTHDLSSLSSRSGAPPTRHDRGRPPAAHVDGSMVQDDDIGDGVLPI